MEEIINEFENEQRPDNENRQQDNLIKYDYYKILSQIQYIVKFYRIILKLDTDRVVLSDRIVQIMNMKQQEIEDSDLNRLLKELTEIKQLSFSLRLGASQDSPSIFLLSQSFTHLTNLTHLTFSILNQDFVYKQNAPFQIPFGLQHMSNLTNFTIFFGDKILENKAAIQIGLSLQKLANLECFSLQIRENKIENDGLVSIAIGLFELKKLQALELIIGKNDIQNEGIATFCQIIQNLNWISSLSLYIEGGNISKQNEAISNLAQLESLSFQISNCTLSSNVGHDKGLRYLINLKFLKLDINNNNNNTNSNIGEGAIEIFSNLRQLNNLTKLIIFVGENNPNKMVLNELGQALENKIQLNELELTISQNKNFVCEGAIAIGNGLKQLKNLTTLSLIIYDDSSIQTEGWINLFEGIVSLHSLTRLRLFIYSENIDIAGIKKFGQNLKNLIFLDRLELTLGYCVLYNKYNVSYLSNGLKYLTNLTSLSLQIAEQSINLNGAEELQLALSGMNNLIHLSITFGGKNLDENKTVLFSLGLGQLVNLKKLALEIQSKNFIGQLGAQKIGESLLNLINLDDLSLTFGEIDLQCEGVQGIAAGLNNLKKLSVLNLVVYKNNIYMEGLDAIFNSFKNLKQLEVLELFIGVVNIYNAEICSNEGVSHLTNLRRLSVVIDGMNIQFNYFYNNLITSLLPLQKLSDLSFTILPTAYLTDIQVDYFYNTFKQLQTLKKFKLFLPFFPNHIYLSLIQDLPNLIEGFIQMPYFEEIYFEKEINTSNNLGEHKIKKLEFKIFENLFRHKNYQELLGIDLGLQNFKYITDLSIKLDNVSSQGLRNIFQGIKSCTTLISFVFKYYDTVEGKTIKEISNALEYLHNLQNLSLSTIYVISLEDTQNMVKVVRNLQYLISLQI